MTFFLESTSFSGLPIKGTNYKTKFGQPDNIYIVGMNTNIIHNVNDNISGQFKFRSELFETVNKNRNYNDIHSQAFYLRYRTSQTCLV